MNAHKRFSLAVMAAVLVAGAMPAYAQTRDTRPTEPERPTIEQPDQPVIEQERDTSDGDSEAVHQPKPNLPRPKIGVSCVVWEKENGWLLARVDNTTGQVIPKGSKVKFTVQPGDVKFTIILNQDWKPGQFFSAIIPDEMELPAECSAQIELTPERADGPLVFEKHDLLDLDPEILKSLPKNYEMKFECYVFPSGGGGASLIFKNKGNVTIPKGAVLHYQLPPTMIWVYYVLTEDLPPGEGFKLKGKYSFLSGKPTECTGMTVYIPPKT